MSRFRYEFLKSVPFGLQPRSTSYWAKMALCKQYQCHDAHQHHSKTRIGYAQNGYEERAYEESASARPYHVHSVGEASNAAHPRFVF